MDGYEAVPTENGTMCRASDGKREGGRGEGEGGRGKEGGTEREGE